MTQQKINMISLSDYSPPAALNSLKSVQCEKADHIVCFSWVIEHHTYIYVSKLNEIKLIYTVNSLFIDCNVSMMFNQAPAFFFSRFTEKDT